MTSTVLALRGDGGPDLVLVYSALDPHERSDTGRNARNPLYGAKQAMLRVVQADGRMTTVALAPLQRRPPDPAVVAVLLGSAHLNASPGREVLVWTGSVSNVNYAEIYSLQDGALAAAGPVLEFTSRSPTFPSGFACTTSPRPGVVQNYFLLDGRHGDLFSAYKQVSVSYRWRGTRLIRAGRQVSQHDHPVPRAQATVGRTCVDGPASASIATDVDEYTQTFARHAA